MIAMLKHVFDYQIEYQFCHLNERDFLTNGADLDDFHHEGENLNLIKIRSSIRSSFFIYCSDKKKKDEERGADRGSDFNQIGENL